MIIELVECHICGIVKNLTIDKIENICLSIIIINKTASHSLKYQNIQN